jgi:ATP-binding cassette, subfamily B, bacterial PglK
MNFFFNIKSLLFIADRKFLNLLPYIFLFIISAMIDVIGLGLIAPIINLIINPDSQLTKTIIEFVSHFTGNHEHNFYLIFFSVLLFILYVIKNLISLASQALIMNFAYKQLASLQCRLMSLYQNMNYLEYIKRKNAEYIRNINELSKYCIDSLYFSIMIIADTIILIVITTYLIFFDFKVLLYLITVIIFIYFPLQLLLKPKSMRYGKNIIEAVVLIYKNISESVLCFKEIKVINKESFFLERIKKAANEIYINKIKNFVAINAPRHMLEIGMIFFIVSFIILFSLKNSDSKDIIAILSVFGVAGIRALPLTANIARNTINLSHHSEPIKIIYNDLINLKKMTKVYDENYFLIDRFENIQFKNVSFKYPSSDQYVFKNLNFSIKSNECIGIVGKSGAGKTTLIDLFLGLLNPQEGEISVNNKIIKKNLDLSKITAYLPQQALTLESSIIDNITLENNRKNIDEKKLISSIKNADLENLIESLPNKTRSVISDEGLRLSGGQNQRLALARIFYHAKEIIIMDEATSSLDKETEELILENINNFKGKKTIIVITHKESTLKYVDKIFEIKNKKLNIINK